MSANVNDPISYSDLQDMPNLITVPSKAGYQIDGKDVYVKKITTTLPNNSMVRISTNLTNVNYVKVEGNAEPSNRSYVIPLPFSDNGSGYGGSVICFINDTNSIEIKTYSDRSNCEATIFVYFTYNE